MTEKTSFPSGDLAVASLVIQVAEQMMDDERRPKIEELREKWDCDEMSEDRAREVVGRVADAAKAGVSLSLTTSETHDLMSYLIHVETKIVLWGMDERRRIRV